MALWRQLGSYYDWYTTADLKGVTIHQWALETPDGNGGSWSCPRPPPMRSSAPAPPLTNSANPVAYKDGGSYFDFDIPANGAATRFDAFTQWGKDTPRLRPPCHCSRPTSSTTANMEVGLDPKNYYSHIDSITAMSPIIHSRTTSSNVKSAQRPSKTPPVSGRDHAGRSEPERGAPRRSRPRHPSWVRPTPAGGVACS